MSTQVRGTNSCIGAGSSRCRGALHSRNALERLAPTRLRARGGRARGRINVNVGGALLRIARSRGRTDVALSGQGRKTSRSGDGLGGDALRRKSSEAEVAHVAESLESRRTCCRQHCSMQLDALARAGRGGCVRKGHFCRTDVCQGSCLLTCGATVADSAGPPQAEALRGPTNWGCFRL